MRGFPEILKTKQDFLNCEQLVSEGKLPAEKLANAYEALLNTRQHYVFDIQLDSEKDRTGPAKDYIVMPNERAQEEAGEKAFSQLKLVVNPNSKIKRLGFTVIEAEKKIAALGGES